MPPSLAQLPVTGPTHKGVVPAFSTNMAQPGQGLTTLTGKTSTRPKETHANTQRESLLYFVCYNLLNNVVHIVL